MNYFLLILGLIILEGITFYKKGEFNKDGYITHEQTKCYEGIFVILVILSHFKNDYITPGASDSAYFAFQNHLGQAIVAMFLFYSGYGIMTSIKHNGKGYIKKIVVRFLNLLIKYDIAVVVYIIFRALIGKTYSISHYLLSLIAWTSIGNSNWFIFATFVLYICVLVSLIPFVLHKKEDKKLSLVPSLIILSVLAAVFVIIMKSAGLEQYRYDTVICFVIGGWMCLFKERIENIFMHSSTTYIILLMLLISAYTVFTILRSGRFIYYEIWMSLFAVLFVVLSMKISLKSSILSFFGEHIFSIYILQRLPMMLFDRVPLLDNHPYIMLILVFAVTIIISIIFDKLTSLIEIRQK